jgi:hypothetical protein
MEVMMNITRYETDVVAWAHQQAMLLRERRFEYLDFANIAEEIEDVGRSQQDELASRMAVLLAHLLKYQFQPDYGNKRSWLRTIKEQRNRLNARLKKTPSLKPSISDEEWIADAWSDAVTSALKETGLDADTFPEVCPWEMPDVLQEDWLP